MIIYIRHAEKEYNNGHSESYKFDPNITEEGMEKTRILANKLLEEYGKPDVIICSPYLRTRETADLISKVVGVDYRIDKFLSEYLGNHKYEKLDVHEETKKYNPPHPETFRKFQTRVYKHNTYMNKFSDKKVWIVTHGLFITELSKIYGIKINYIDCLSGIVMKEGKILNNI